MPKTINEILATPREFVVQAGDGDQLDITSGAAARVFSILVTGPTAAARCRVYNNPTATGEYIELTTQDYYSFSKDFGDAGFLFENGISIDWTGGTATDQCVVTYLDE
jgi:hypothetical protein